MNDVGSDLVEVFIRDLALAVLGDGFVDAAEEVLNLRLLVDAHHYFILINITFN